jgi:hypothetical protein
VKRNSEKKKNKMRGEWRRMMEGLNSSMIYLIYCKKFCKCHNIAPLSTTIKKEKKNNSFLEWSLKFFGFFVRLYKLFKIPLKL